MDQSCGWYNLPARRTKRGQQWETEFQILVPRINSMVILSRRSRLGSGNRQTDRLTDNRKGQPQDKTTMILRGGSLNPAPPWSITPWLSATFQCHEEVEKYSWVISHTEAKCTWPGLCESQYLDENIKKLKDLCVKYIYSELRRLLMHPREDFLKVGFLLNLKRKWDTLVCVLAPGKVDLKC